jgi:hypothetical protein
MFLLIRWYISVPRIRTAASLVNLEKKKYVEKYSFVLKRPIITTS